LQSGVCSAKEGKPGKKNLTDPAQSGKNMNLKNWIKLKGESNEGRPNC